MHKFPSNKKKKAKGVGLGRRQTRLETPIAAFLLPLVYFIKTEKKSLAADSFYLLFPLIALQALKW